MSAAALIVALHIEELSELELGEALPVIVAFRAKLDGFADVETALDDPSFGCESKDRCFDEVRARTGAGEVVMIRLTAGPKRVQMRVRRAAGGQSAQALLDRQPGLWDSALFELAQALFPEARPRLAETRTATRAIIAVEGAERAPPYVAYALGGAGIVSTIAGIACAAVNSDARGQIRDELLPAEEYEALRGRAKSFGLASSVLITAGVAAIGTGLTWWIVDASW